MGNKFAGIGSSTAGDPGTQFPTDALGAQLRRLLVGVLAAAAPTGLPFSAQPQIARVAQSPERATTVFGRPPGAKQLSSYYEDLPGFIPELRRAGIKEHTLREAFVEMSRDTGNDVVSLTAKLGDEPLARPFLVELAKNYPKEFADAVTEARPRLKALLPEALESLLVTSPSRVPEFVDIVEKQLAFTPEQKRAAIRRAFEAAAVKGDCEFVLDKLNTTLSHLPAEQRDAISRVAVVHAATNNSPSLLRHAPTAHRVLGPLGFSRAVKNVAHAHPAEVVPHLVSLRALSPDAYEQAVDAIVTESLTRGAKMSATMPTPDVRSVQQKWMGVPREEPYKGVRALAVLEGWEHLKSHPEAADMLRVQCAINGEHVLAQWKHIETSPKSYEVLRMAMDNSVRFGAGETLAASYPTLVSALKLSDKEQSSLLDRLLDSDPINALNIVVGDAGSGAGSSVRRYIVGRSIELCATYNPSWLLDNRESLAKLLPKESRFESKALESLSARLPALAFGRPEAFLGSEEGCRLLRRAANHHPRLFLSAFSRYGPDIRRNKLVTDLERDAARLEKIDELIRDRALDEPGRQKALDSALETLLGTTERTNLRDALATIAKTKQINLRFTGLSTSPAVWSPEDASSSSLPDLRLCFIDATSRRISRIDVGIDELRAVAGSKDQLLELLAMKLEESSASLGYLVGVRALDDISFLRAPLVSRNTAVMMVVSGFAHDDAVAVERYAADRSAAYRARGAEILQANMQRPERWAAATRKAWAGSPAADPVGVTDIVNDIARTLQRAAEAKRTHFLLDWSLHGAQNGTVEAIDGPISPELIAEAFARPFRGEPGDSRAGKPFVEFMDITVLAGSCYAHRNAQLVTDDLTTRRTRKDRLKIKNVTILAEASHLEEGSNRVSGRTCCIAGSGGDRAGGFVDVYLGHYLATEPSSRLDSRHVGSAAHAFEFVMKMTHRDTGGMQRPCLTVLSDSIKGGRLVIEPGAEN